MSNVTDGLNCGNCPLYGVGANETVRNVCLAHPRIGMMNDGEQAWEFPPSNPDDLCGEHPVLKARLRVLEEQFLFSEMRAWQQSHQVLVPTGGMVKP